MSKPAYKGVVKRGTVVLEEESDLPDGAEVLVTPLEAERGEHHILIAGVVQHQTWTGGFVLWLTERRDGGRVLVRRSS